MKRNLDIDKITKTQREEKGKMSEIGGERRRCRISEVRRKRGRNQKSEGEDVRSQISEIRGQKSEGEDVRNRKSEVRNQKSEGKEEDIRCQKSEEKGKAGRHCGKMKR